jgi:hypothetical protein
LSTIGQAGWSVGLGAWRLGVSIREYREIEAGERWLIGRREGAKLKRL